ncbi:hypothetical protein C8F04DRAFT_1058302 [Mycena alexandri]|uniref:Uncharacterized protein n=1 Tax=Mycena alexandri TaxID=1745969 RepID=A0AAD6TL03_9AGAR|nr:hypothetical protein C8F04DRAFT_1058302 [Mycena alexandri]
MPLTFGNPDPSILRSSEFQPTDIRQFKFQTIGKEPQLLKRLSGFREDDVRYQHSPSPEPESSYDPFPPYAHAEPRTRPSLLQALTNHESHEPSAPFESFLPSAQPSSSLESPGLDYDMQLQYPETPVDEPLPKTTIRNPTPPPPLPPFIPNYAALKELHTRLESSHKVLALPPPPRKAKTPPPEFPRPSLIAANNAVHHTEKAHASAKEALDASQTRVAISEQGLATAQTIVDSLAQALLAARTSLEAAQKSLADARQVADEAQSALLASRAAADAAEETKRLLEEPPPPRAPTPEPVNENAELIVEMKKDLDTLRLWVEEQEAGHLPAAPTPRDSSRDREEEEEREASRLMISPDDNDTDMEGHDVNDTSTELPAPQSLTDEEVDEFDMEIDEPRRLEEDAARALVALAEQKITPQDVRQQQPTAPTQGSENGRAGAVAVSAQNEDLQATEAALAREAALRKQQDTRREQVRVQKQHAHAAAALSILKERQDAAEKRKSSPAQSSLASSVGNVVAKGALVPPATKVKTKKAKPVSGGVKLGPDTVNVESPPAVLSEPSPALERAAALGLRVRTANKSGVTQSAPNSKAGSKNMQNFSLPASPVLDRGSPDTDEVSASRTGPDPGDIRILRKAPKLPEHLSTDVQLMNLRFALQEEGITWEAISRSRPPVPRVNTEVKTEEPQEVLRTTPTSSSAPPPKPTAPAPQPPLPTKTPISAPVVTPIPITQQPLPSRKQLPKFNKSTAAATGNADNGQPKPATAPSAAQPQPILPTRLNGDSTALRVRPPEAPPASIPPKRSPPRAPKASAYEYANTQNTGDHTSAPAIPRVQAESRLSYHGSGASTSVQRTDSPSYRSLNERVSQFESQPWDPLRYDARLTRPRSRSPERYAASSYRGGEPQRFRRRTSTPPPIPPILPAFNKWSRPLSPRARTPSPPRRGQFPTKRGFSGDHYSPAGPHRPSASTSSYIPLGDSPPKAPRQAPRAPSQKRLREDDYTAGPPSYPQKRFKDDGRDGSRSAISPAAYWNEEPGPSLGDRLATSNNSNVHFVGRGENYRPAPEIPDDEWTPASKPDGLLSRLSDPSRSDPGRSDPGRSDSVRGNARGRGSIRGTRGQTRGRAFKPRGRGRGERSLADRMVWDSTVRRQFITG